MIMELELGLAPPTQSRPMVGFDLNNVFKPNEMVRNGCSLEIKHYVKDKNTSAEAFEQEGIETETLSLLLWNGQPNEEDDQNRQKRRRFNTIIKRSGEEDHHLMGWPPIKSWRRKLHDGHQGCRIATHRITERGSNRTNSTYIKVKMEGVAIGRKIDLKLHHSYQTLANSLINMFVKSPKSDIDDANYTLLYQDKDRDWLLVGDVPWQTFIDSVHRMKILRNGE